MTRMIGRILIMAVLVEELFEFSNGFRKGKDDNLVIDLKLEIPVGDQRVFTPDDPSYQSRSWEIQVL